MPTNKPFYTCSQLERCLRIFFPGYQALLTYGLEMVEWEAIDLHVHVN